MASTPDPEADPVRLARINERILVTGKLTETTRYVGLGLPALYYGIISSSTPFTNFLVQNHSVALSVSAILGILTIILDNAQFLCARASVKYALERTDKPNLHNTDWQVYKWRQRFFLFKQGTAAVGAILMIAVIGMAAGAETVSTTPAASTSIITVSNLPPAA